MAEPELTFTHKERGARGTFMAWHQGNHAGTMTYERLDPATVNVDHTETEPSMEGVGVGRAMVAHLVEWARANGQQVVATCPFTKKVLARHAEWQDVVHRQAIPTEGEEP